MITRPVSLPTIVTMNDLSWHHEPSWHPAERLQWIDRNLQATLRQATRFVAISQFTKDAVVRDLGIAAELIDVIPLAPAQEFRPITAAEAAAALARYDLDGPALHLLDLDYRATQEFRPSADGPSPAVPCPAATGAAGDRGRQGLG